MKKILVMMVAVGLLVFATSATVLAENGIRWPTVDSVGYWGR